MKNLLATWGVALVVVVSGHMALAAEQAPALAPIIQLSGPQMLGALKDLARPEQQVAERYLEYIRLKADVVPRPYLNLDISEITPPFVPGLRLFRGRLVDYSHAVVDGPTIVLDTRDFAIWDGKFYARPFDESEKTLDDLGYNRELTGLKLCGIKYWELFHKTYMVEMERDKNVRKDLKVIEQQLAKIASTECRDLGAALTTYFLAAPNEARLSQIAALALMYLRSETAQARVKWVAKLPEKTPQQDWRFQTKLPPSALKLKATAASGELHGFAVVESDRPEFYEVELLVTPKQFKIRTRQLGAVRELPRG